MEEQDIHNQLTSTFTSENLPRLNTDKASQSVRYRLFDPDGVAKIKPVKTVERLLNQQMPRANLTGGFSQRTSSEVSGKLLDKVRRNKQALKSSQNNQSSSVLSDYQDVVPLFASKITPSPSAVDPRLLYKHSSCGKRLLSRGIARSHVSASSATTFKDDDSIQETEATNVSQKGKSNHHQHVPGDMKKPKEYLSPSVDFHPQVWPFVL